VVFNSISGKFVPTWSKTHKYVIFYKNSSADEYWQCAEWPKYISIPVHRIYDRNRLFGSQVYQGIKLSLDGEVCLTPLLALIHEDNLKSKHHALDDTRIEWI